MWNNLKKIIGSESESATATVESVESRPSIPDIIEQGRIRIAFQPLVDLATGEVFGNEALLRCSVRKLDVPEKVLAHAIETSCMGELGRHIRTHAVTESPLKPLFLNVHPNEFSEGWLVRPDDPMFWHKGPVTIEITEAVPVSHFQWCLDVLSEIRRRGVTLAVDDLGSGFSNLRYISDLAPEYVKFDRTLVHGLPENKRQRQLVKSLVNLCVDMGAKTVAEGIETNDELQAVCDAGAHYGQGFLLARPALPAKPVRWPEGVRKRGVS